MAQATSIEWTEQVWNFLRGCRRVSEGCTNCYAERQAIRHAGPGGPYEGLVKSTPNGPRWTGEISFHEEILLAPLRRKKPTTYFVNSMSDLFYERVQEEWLDKAFAVMALTPQHTYQILTKRPERMRSYFNDSDKWCEVLRLATTMGKLSGAVATKFAFQGADSLPNVWLGVSVEDQKTADARIPLLLDTPAAVRWMSAEPLLGKVDLWAPRYQKPNGGLSGAISHSWKPALDWVVVGGESGPGARSFDIGWCRLIIQDCRAANVPVFVKQLGAAPFEPARYQIVGDAGLYLNSRKGSDMAEWPEDLRIRQMPEVSNA